MSAVILLFSACSNTTQSKTLTLNSFNCELSFSCYDVKYSGVLEYTSANQIKFTVENPAELKGVLIEEANGETLAKMGDAYISLDRAEKLFRNGSCFTELFEILGTMGSQTFEQKNDGLITGIYSNGDFSAKIVEVENVPEYIETEDYKFVFESVKRSNA